jgi:ribosomal protein S18 acetylase RimI-like enzyme
MVRIERGLLSSDLDRFREIFFLTSVRKHFDSLEEKERFFERWTGYYRRAEPESLFVARNEVGELIGYLTGCKNTRLAPDLMNPLWTDLFVRFPAHFHINCHPQGQRMGIGTMLVEEFVKYLCANGLSGVFIVTDPEAENKKFYRKNGFGFEVTRSFNGRSLVFMGRELVPST